MADGVAAVCGGYGGLVGSFRVAAGEPGKDAWRAANQLVFRGYSLSERQGRWAEAYEICERMVQEGTKRNDLEVIEANYGNQAIFHYLWGNLDKAMALRKKEEAMAIARRDEAGLSRCYGNQAVILNDLGKSGEAYQYLKRKEEICRRNGDLSVLHNSYGNQALILRDWGLLPEALALLEKQEAICEHLGDREGLGASYGNQGVILQSAQASEADGKHFHLLVHRHRLVQPAGHLEHHCPVPIVR